VDGGTFRGNSAPTAGAMRLGVSHASTLQDVVMEDNEATDLAGALLVTLAGGYDPQLTITNSTFSGNTAARGAGVAVDTYELDVPAPLRLSGVTLEGNVASEQGGGLYLDALLTDPVSLESCDLGEGASDNLPDDIWAGSAAFTGYGADTSLQCDPMAGTCQ
jgi:hypothetical protein